MSVREEDRQKNCPSRGLGIAAAAIGVGVGAALYYFFSKRSENPDGEGSSTDWSSEQAHAFRDRSWKVEECSICFEGMQENQEVLSLECTHRFHQTCILPWLRESHTCPNCRKEAFVNI